jgi:hypothetical protein
VGLLFRIHFIICDHYILEGQQDVQQLLTRIPFRILGEVDLGFPSAAYRIHISGGFIHNMVTGSMHELEVPQSSPLVDNVTETPERTMPPSTLVVRIPSQMVRTAFPSIVDAYEASAMETSLPNTRKVKLKSANSVSDTSRTMSCI